MSKPTAAQKYLPDSLQRIAKQLYDDLTKAMEDGKWRRYSAHERDAVMVLRAGVAMFIHGEKAERLSSDWVARGLPGGQDEPVSGGGISDPTPLAAASTDEWEKQLAALRDERDVLARTARDYESNVAGTVRRLENEGRRSSLIECANPKCDHTMTGLGDDRPRKGRCDRCRKHLERYDIDWPARAQEEDAA